MSVLLEGRRVLVVEDQYLLAEELTRTLRRWGAEVVGPVSNAERAFKLIATTGLLDFALLDVNLNGQAVYPVAELLERRGTPFVFVTGYGRDAIRADFADAPYLDKPVVMARLLPVLETLAASLPSTQRLH